MLRNCGRTVVTAGRAAVQLSSRRTVATTHGQILDNSAHDNVTQKIGNELSDQRKRLFAVVYVNEKQFKVGQNDLIALEGNLPLKVGDKITLDKVLMVGGSSFSLFGRPLLPQSAVTVNATVVEKTTKSPELNYAHYNHKQIHIVNWMSTEQTIVRVNEITADPSAMGSQ